MEKIATLRNRGGLLADVATLGKPRILVMVLVATAVGYLVAAAPWVDMIHLAGVLLGTALVGGGVNGLNQYLERRPDALMARTRNRPLPAGRLRPEPVLIGGAVASLAGVALLAWWANLLSGSIGALVIVTYLACYTPLKRVTGLNTLVGAVPGALPPVLGWVAARGSVGSEALAMFLILFVWQLAHFLSIAYLYREDYRVAGMPMISVTDASGGAVRRQLVLYTATLIPVSMYPSIIGMAGLTYFYGAALLGALFLAAALAMAWRPSELRAQICLKVSVAYLAALLPLLVYDSAGWARL